jgi:hypothetical protein
MIYLTVAAVRSLHEAAIATAGGSLGVLSERAL